MKMIAGVPLVTLAEQKLYLESGARGADAMKRRIEQEIESLKWWQRPFKKAALEAMRDAASDLAMTYREELVELTRRRVNA